MWRDSVNSANEALCMLQLGDYYCSCEVGLLLIFIRMFSIHSVYKLNECYLTTAVACKTLQR